MFIKSIMLQTRHSRYPEQWSHQINRNSPIVALGLKNPKPEEWWNSVFVRFETVSCHFMLIEISGELKFYYSLQSFSGPGKLTREDGEFIGFDSVSAVFHGIRFHWSRESEKIIITDAVAR